jgi:hypothetical protein
VSEILIEVFRWKPKEGVVTFPADGVTFNFIVEGVLGCFYFIEERFNSG